MKTNKMILVVIMCIFFTLFNNIYATDVFSQESENVENVDNLNQVEDITQSASDVYNLDEYIDTINRSVSENLEEKIDFRDMASELINKNDINYNKLFTKLIGLFSKEVSSTIKSSITIFIILVIMAIASNFSLEKNSDITKIAYLACFILIATITLATFLDVIKMLKSVVSTMTTLMQVISPFLLSILIATGSISTTGIIQPLLLFLASAVGFVITYFVVPLLSISVAFNVICSISENIRLERLSKMFSSVSIWSIGVMLTVFLGVLSLETTITSSVDSLGVKTTQAAVSNFVPVVGKFFSDSFEVVVGATKIIGKTGGVLGIIGIIIVALIPILKILSIMLVYMLLTAIAEPLIGDSALLKYLSFFTDMYKTVLGILVGVAMLFIISTGIILNLVNNIVV